MNRVLNTLLPLVLLVARIPAAQGQCSTTNASSCQCPDGTPNCELRPDMTISWYGILNYLGGPSEEPGRVRISGSTPNIGHGPLEVRGVDLQGNRRFTCGVDTFVVQDPNAELQFTCPNGGMAKQLTTQRIFEKSGNQMTSYERVMPQGMTFVSTQNNTRYDQWGIFSLRLPEPGVSDPLQWPIIAEGYKLGFCLMDYNNCGQSVVNHHCKDDNTTYNAGTTLYPADFPNYGLGGGNYGCSKIRQGISSGYTDIYSEYLDGMWIDIPAGTCNGEYWIIAQVDPFDLLLEEDKTNNYTAVPYTLTQQVSGAPAATITCEQQAFVCTGEQVELKANSGLSYQWSNGATTNSILAGPGTYTVTVTTYCGTATSVPYTVTELPQPDAPYAEDVLICEGEAAVLSTTAADAVWYDALGDLVATGPQFVTPPLFTSTSYTVRDRHVQPGIVTYGGKPNNTGTGEYHAGAQFLRFDVNKAFRLKSVLVYAGSPGWRTVEWVDHIGVMRATRSIYLPAGSSRMDLDFDLPPGKGYKLIVAGTADLWRSNSGVNYPYVIGDVATITGSSGGASFYYYFFDWEVEYGGGECLSDPTPVEVEVQVCTGVAEALPLRGFEVFPNPNTGAFTIELHLLRDTRVDLTLMDAVGRVVYTGSQAAAAGQWRHPMHMEGLAKGMYHLNVDLAGRRFSKRVVVQ